MSEKLCIFCAHFRWSKEEMDGMGSTLTGPMMSGGDATCSAGQHPGKWDKPYDEADFRRVILNARECTKYEPAL